MDEKSLKEQENLVEEEIKDKEEDIKEVEVKEKEIQEPQESNNESNEIVSKKKKVNIKEKVAQIKSGINEAYNNLSECKNLVLSKLDELEEVKKKNEPIFKESEKLLKELNEPAEIVIEIKKSVVELPEEEILEIKEPPSGKFKGFIAGIIGAAATVGGWLIYFKKGIDINSLGDINFWNQFAKEVAQKLSLAPNEINGYGVIGLSAIAVGAILYKIVTYLQYKKNIKYIEELEEKSKEYCKSKEECLKRQQELIDHIEHIKDVIEKYGVLLNEENAKLKRILFIEKPKSYDDLHSKSKAEMTQTRVLLEEIRNLIDTEISINGEVNPQSDEALRSANRIANEFLRALYS